MVRLKEAPAEGTEGEMFDFNSNMVRLKVCTTPNLTASATRFQFQYGSIKSMMMK